ncbi:MAG: phosphatase PAP2 family protein [Gammaproteobacteria bacterium]|nr:phosphatase PAP2 family protein [Pseudomonadales bacterium]
MKQASLFTHSLFAILLSGCLISWWSGYSEITSSLLLAALWCAYTVGQWVLYPRIANRWQFQFAAFGTIACLLTLYLVLAPVAFSAIPWQADTWLSELESTVGAPVLALQPLAQGWKLEFFAAVYALFIPYLYLSLLVNLLSRDHERRSVFVLAFAVTYAISYLGYFLVPARGPVVAMSDAFGMPVHGGFFTGLVQASIDASGGPHGAFPSLHVGATTLMVLFDLRYKPIRAVLYLPFLALIILATLVLRYHYTIDLLAGVVIAVLAMIYSLKSHGLRLAGGLQRFMLQLFYSKIRQQGSLPQDDMPTLVVANHANAFIDPFVLEAACNRSLVKTANSAWFRNPAGRFLAWLLNTHPLARRDESDTDRGRINSQTFQRLRLELKRNRWVVIFPEGKSHDSTTLLPFRSGAARLAMDFVATNQLPLRLLPIYLNYRAKAEQGSKISVHVGDGLVLTPETLAALTVQELTAKIARAVQTLSTAEAAQFSHQPSESSLQRVMDSFKRWELRLLGWPLLMAGKVLHLIPTLAHRKLVRKYAKDTDQVATITFATGLPLYPFYWCVLALVSIWLGLLGTLSGLFLMLHRTCKTDRSSELYSRLDYPYNNRIFPKGELS